MPFYLNVPQAVFGGTLLTVGTLATRASLQRVPLPQWARRTLVAIVFAWLALSLDLGLPGELCRPFHSPASVWSSAIALFWVGISAGISIFLLARAPGREFDPGRRLLLRTGGAAALAAPLAATGYGMYLAGKTPRVTEWNVPVAGLHPDLEGLRIVQLSDIHLSPFYSRRDLARAVSLANETRAHIAVVTGDLISSAADPLDECIEELQRLRSDAGILGCLGNHEIYARAEDTAELLGRNAGIEFLRGEARKLRFGSTGINIAGVDYQRKGFPYLPGAGSLLESDTPNLLLSHNPDVLPVAAELGFDVMLSGHTHGGQVTAEILHRSLTPARFYTPFVRGLYSRGRTTGFVTTGLGTVGAPIRIGAEPEIALIHLVKA